MKKYVIFGILSVSIIVLLVIGSDVIKGNASDKSDLFRMDGDCLAEYSGDSKDVVLPNDVKSIGEDAFVNNEYMETVTLPEGLTEICYEAFSGCTKLKSIEIPDSVETVKSSAFAKCTSLEKVSIGKGLSSLGSGVFADCSLLKSVEVSPDNKYFTCLSGALYSADRTVLYQYLIGNTSNYYVMNSRVKSIEQYAFWGANSLEYVTVSDSLDKIDDYAFSNCKSLKSLTMSFAVKSIEMKAFEDCIALEQVYIPNSVSFIHETAFDGCKKVQLLTEDGFYASKYAQAHNIEFITEPKYQTDLAENLSNKTIKEKENELLVITAEPVQETQTANADEEVLGSSYIVADRAVILMNNQGTDVTYGEENSENNRIRKLTDESGKVKDSAFYLDETLSNVELPNAVNSIGKFSFARSSIESLIIPDTVTSIEYGAFYHCDKLKDVVIPYTVTDIGENAFEKTPWLQEWYDTSPENYLIVGDGILLAYKGKDKDFQLPANVKKVACDIPSN